MNIYERQYVRLKLYVLFLANEVIRDQDEWFLTPDPVLTPQPPQPPPPKILPVVAKPPPLKYHNQEPRLPNGSENKEDEQRERNEKENQESKSPSYFLSDTTPLSANTSVKKRDSVRLPPNFVAANPILDSRITSNTHDSFIEIEGAAPVNPSSNQQPSPVSATTTPVDRVTQPPLPLDSAPVQNTTQSSAVGVFVPGPIPDEINPTIPQQSRRQAKKVARKKAREQSKQQKAAEMGKQSRRSPGPVRFKSPQPVTVSVTDPAHGTLKDAPSPVPQQVMCLNNPQAVGDNARSPDQPTKANSHLALNFKPGIRSLNVRLCDLKEPSL